MGKNPGVTPLILVWWLYLIAKRIISNKIGGGRKDSAAVMGSRGEKRRGEPGSASAQSLASAPGFSLQEGSECWTQEEWGAGRWGDGQGREAGLGRFRGLHGGRELQEPVGGSQRSLYLVRRQRVLPASNWIIVDMLMRRLGCW